MRGLILAAGRGSRLSDLTANKPKCLVAFNGRTLLSRQIAAMRDAGVAEIGIVTGYRSDLLQDVVDVTFRNDRWAETGVVASLACAAVWLRAGPVLVSYSDIFYSAETVLRTIASTSTIAMAYDPHWARLWARRFDDPYSDAETFEIDERSRVTKIGDRASPASPPVGQFMGIVRFLPEAWGIVEAGLPGSVGSSLDELDMTALLRAAVACGIEVEAVPSTGPWGEVDRPCDLTLYAELFPDV